MTGKELAQMYRAHFGKIFFNISIAALVSMFLIGVAPMVLVFVAWFLMIIIGMVSLFILFFNEDFRNMFSTLTELLNGLGFETLAPIVVGLGVVGIVSSVLSIVFTATNKGNVQKDRVIGSIAVLILTVIAMIVIYVIKGGAQ